MQHDYNIANQARSANLLTDISSALKALATDNAGDTEPSVTFPYMTWLDTSGATPVLKQRNAANNGWITVKLPSQQADGFLHTNLSLVQGTGHQHLTSAQLQQLLDGPVAPIGDTPVQIANSTVFSETSAPNIAITGLTGDLHQGYRFTAMFTQINTGVRCKLSFSVNGIDLSQGFAISPVAGNTANNQTYGFGGTYMYGTIEGYITDINRVPVVYGKIMYFGSNVEMFCLTSNQKLAGQIENINFGSDKFGGLKLVLYRGWHGGR